MAGFDFQCRNSAAIVCLFFWFVSNFVNCSFKQIQPYPFSGHLVMHFNHSSMCFWHQCFGIWWVAVTSRAECCRDNDGHRLQERWWRGSDACRRHIEESLEPSGILTGLGAHVNWYHCLLFMVIALWMSPRFISSTKAFPGCPSYTWNCLLLLEWQLKTLWQKRQYFSAYRWYTR